MRELVIDEATLEDTATHVRAAVEDLGGVVSEHALVRTRFDTLRPGGEAFARAGYVGVYQPYGQKSVTLRVRIWALWPRRLVHLVLFLGAFLALLLFLVRPDPSVWVLSALASWVALGIVFLVYAGTFDVTRRIEGQLVERITEGVETQMGANVHTRDEWDERAERLKKAAKLKAKEIKGRAKPEDVRSEAPEASAGKDAASPDAPSEDAGRSKDKRRRFGLKLPFGRRGEEE